VTVRRATDADRETMRSLWDEWVGDSSIPPWAPDAREDTYAELDVALQEGIAVVAEDGGEVVGFAAGVLRGPLLGEVTELYVTPSSRRRGLGAQLLRAILDGLRERGAEFVNVGVGPENAAARSLYEGAGFRVEQLRLIADADALDRVDEPAAGRSYGAVHIQSDDLPAVERAVRQFVPRLPGNSRGSIVTGPRHGWIAVYDDVCDRDPTLLRRLAREISDRMGAVALSLGVEEDAVVRFVLLEHGRIVDEYLSVQEYYGPLPPGDVVALAANPRVVARLTGAEPEAVRRAALHARSPADLPPAAEVIAGIANAIGIAGAEHGWADAPELPDSIRIDRA
jgi:ribosomal protein S18 acetylase RimI-like enzyme